MGQNGEKRKHAIHRTKKQRAGHAYEFGFLRRGAYKKEETRRRPKREEKKNRDEKEKQESGGMGQNGEKRKHTIHRKKQRRGHAYEFGFFRRGAYKKEKTFAAMASSGQWLCSSLAGWRQKTFQRMLRPSIPAFQLAPRGSNGGALSICFIQWRMRG